MHKVNARAKRMKKTLENLVIFGSLGAVVGGVMTGSPSQYIAIPAMILYSLAFFEILTVHKRGQMRLTIIPSRYRALLFYIVYTLFMIQGLSLVIGGSSLIPKGWWIIHSGAAVYIYFLIHSITPRK